MHHITKAATVVATTDQGEFSAIIAAYSVDRVGDRIAFGAFAKTIAKWQESGKQIPLHWDHKGDPQYIIGSFDPATMEEVKDKGLMATGHLDLENSEMAREAWRAMKTGSMSLSFGYLVPNGMEKKGRDGINDIFEIDLFEGTIAPAPVNADTQILSMKSAEELREDSIRLERELNDERLPEIPKPVQAVEPEPEPSTVEDIVSLLKTLPETERQTLRQALGVPDPKDPETLRKDSERLEREIAETKIPDIPEQPKAPAEPEIDLAKTLEEVKAELAETRASFEDFKKKAEVTDQEPTARSVDPLRKRSEELALEVASGGMSLRKPPTPVKATPPEPVDLDALKRESHDLMFEVLSYSTE